MLATFVPGLPLPCDRSLSHPAACWMFDAHPLPQEGRARRGHGVRPGGPSLPPPRRSYEVSHPSWPRRSLPACRATRPPPVPPPLRPTPARGPTPDPPEPWLRFSGLSPLRGQEKSVSEPAWLSRRTRSCPRWPPTHRSQGVAILAWASDRGQERLPPATGHSGSPTPHPGLQLNYAREAQVATKLKRPRSGERHLRQTRVGGAGGGATRGREDSAGSRPKLGRKPPERGAGSPPSPRTPQPLPISHRGKPRFRPSCAYLVQLGARIRPFRGSQVSPLLRGPPSWPHSTLETRSPYERSEATAGSPRVV